MAEEPHSIGDILERLEGIAEKKEQTTIGDMVEAFGTRSYGPFLIVPSLIELSPIGGIPGVPSVLAAIIILFAGQIALGRSQFWVPKLLANRSVKSERLKKATGKLRPIGDWLDRWFHGRLPALTKGPFIRVAAVACILLALTVPPLELLPFASSAPMLAIAMFGLALLVRDGVLMIAASVLAVLAVAVGVGWFVSGG